jgi:hypothetical protein
VKSTDFYKVLNEVIADKFTDVGFERVKSATLFWHLKMGRKHLFYKVRVSIKSNYSPIHGGDFLIEINLLSKNTPDKVGFRKGFISFMQYFSDEELERMKEIRDAVLRKILARTEFESEFDRHMFDLFQPLFKREMGQPYRRDFVEGLHYLDHVDIASWGSLLASNIARTVKGIEKRPICFEN